MKDHYNLFKHTDEFLTRKKFTTQREKRFYPSEASVKFTDSHGNTVVEGGCLRRSYFRLTSTVQAEPNDARSEWIFKQGNAVEKILIDTWKEMGIWIADHVKFVNTDYNISGELDALLSEPDGTIFGMEAKSFYGYFGEKEIFGNTKQAGFPKINQLLQTLIYTWHFRDKLPYFRMAYFARDSVKRKTFKISLLEDGDKFWPVIDGHTYTRFSVNDILDRYRELESYIAMGQVPPNDYELKYSPEKVERYKKQGLVSKSKYEKYKTGKLKTYEFVGDWQCSYCPYKSHCWPKDIKQKGSNNEG